MRNAFVNELKKQMENDENVFLLTGDLGFSVFEDIKNNFGSQYINMGIAEQNMIGVASGLAMTGKKVYVYSIIPFLLYRAFEQIRNDVCYQNLPIKLVGVGAGYTYSDAGFTHHAIEDYGILSSLPNLTILSPADPLEVSVQMKQIFDLTGPSYIRLTKNGEPILHNKHDSLVIGKALSLKYGDEILIISTGISLSLSNKISNQLEQEGFSTEILNYHTLKPFDKEKLIESSRGKRLIVTIEEHLIYTGLYSFVAQTVQESGSNIKILPFGILNPLTHLSGNREFMLSQNGINSNSIYNRILKELRK